ncbi:MAG: hypothetical protein KME46_11175 [Brasilonema angustatum HA4187-MV1]|jgi:hypothetical protein|nr:hypothetical protein [Brasilonema angustatum HA4187-MV1]
MNVSLEDYLKIVTPHLDPELVSSQALAQIQALAQRLPISSANLLECRLNGNEPDVDFHASFTHFPPELSDRFLPNLAWQACQTFAQKWMDSASSLHQSINNLILEFDLPEQPTDQQFIEAISPSPYIMFKPETTINLQELIEHSLRLFQYPLNSQLTAKLKHCLSSLPDGAKLANIGVWLARPNQGLRLTIKEILFEQLPIYLEQIGWEDPTHALALYSSTLSPFVDTLALAIDIDQTVHPRIGLECFVTKQFHDQSRWQQFIDHLVHADLCTPGKRNALLDWSGFTQRSDCPELWPANLTYGDILMGSNAVSFFWRRINHIKIVYQPGQPLSAKAYLAFGHSWMSADNVVFQEKPSRPSVAC